ncbi:hypothetical protein AWZ03_009517 [Drosophila navojoa]|uniref:fumarate hydratase n=1 Tax=Drosophila navojoa TaxID=7232 RepID=A0A484B718_DRONA|nr:probable fumarate hydratase, mitochondrial [Drosophila navojoa]TDG44092.1 hypothetical protein AWZ03_009517 [Drosophila navojoa]
MSFDQKEMFGLLYKLARMSQADTRIEHDEMGAIRVPLDRMYGPQTMRSVMNFPIGGVEERMPRPIIVALGIIKKAAAQTNRQSGLEPLICDAILKASDDVISGKLYDENHFPLVIWQAGSGTSTNMNVNEVISNRAIEIMGGQVGSKEPVDAVGHVDMSQSCCDNFSSAINIAVVMQLNEKLFPSIKALIEVLDNKEQEFKHIIKIARTHLMDAEPMTLGHVFGGYKQMMINNSTRLESCMQRLHEISLNSEGCACKSCSANFGAGCISGIAELTGLSFVSAPNMFEAVSARDSLVELHGELNSIVVSLMKIVNDVRLMASGPRCGFGELVLPEDAPGSSLMPDNVSTRQCEVLTMICAQVMGNQVAVSIGSSNGHFELNAFMPLIASNVLRSIGLLSDGLSGFTNSCLKGIRANEENIMKTLNQSLVMAVPLQPYVGHDKAVEIANLAYANGTTVKWEAYKKGLSNADLEKWLHVDKLLSFSYQ